MCGEADALGFSAGKCVSGAIELEVAKADFAEEGEALADFGKDVAGDKGGAFVGEGNGEKVLGGVGDGEGRGFGNGKWWVLGSGGCAVRLGGGMEAHGGCDGIEA